MSVTAQIHPSRRAMLAWLVTAAVAASASAVAARDGNELDPADRVPRRFSLERFLALDSNDIHDVHLAIRRGKRIIVDGFSASESREIIRRAARDWPTVRAELLRQRGG